MGNVSSQRTCVHVEYRRCHCVALENCTQVLVECQCSVETAVGYCFATAFRAVETVHTVPVIVQLIRCRSSALRCACDRVLPKL